MLKIKKSGEFIINVYYHDDNLQIWAWASMCGDMWRSEIEVTGCSTGECYGWSRSYLKPTWESAVTNTAFRAKQCNPWSDVVALLNNFIQEFDK